MPTDTITGFRDCFSYGRTYYYEEAAGNDPELALYLYDWNIRVSAAFLEDLAVAEVVLRNALDIVLRKANANRQEWYTTIPVSDPEKTMLEKAIEDSHNDSDTVIAVLPFGFWRGIVGAKYRTTLWPVLQEAFPHNPSGRPKQYQVDDWVSHLHDLRNEVAHHKFILDRDLRVSATYIKSLTGSISPKAQIWMVGRSRVAGLLAQRPT